MLKFIVESFSGEIVSEKSFDYNILINDIVFCIDLKSFNELLVMAETNLDKASNLIFKIITEIIESEGIIKEKLNFEQKKILNSLKSYLIELYTLSQTRKNLKLKIEIL